MPSSVATPGFSNVYEEYPSYAPSPVSVVSPSSIEDEGNPSVSEVCASPRRNTISVVKKVSKIANDSDSDDESSIYDSGSHTESLNVNKWSSNESSVGIPNFITKVSNNTNSLPPLSVIVPSLPRPPPVTDTVDTTNCGKKSRFTSRTSHYDHPSLQPNTCCRSYRKVAIITGVVILAIIVSATLFFDKIIDEIWKPEFSQVVPEKPSDDPFIDHGWIGCNGLESNCNLRLNEVMFATVHNAMSSREDNFKFANHLYNMEKALVEGYRAFFLDTCDCTPVEETGIDLVLKFCHGWCLAGSRDPKELLSYLTAFLTVNKGEVIILEFEIGSSEVSDIYHLLTLWNVMSNIDGFSNMVYVYDNKLGKWPTLGELVETNKRIILFQHSGPACDGTIGCPAQFHNFYDHVIESSFSVSSIEEMEDSTSCALVLGNGGSRKFFNLNHFLNGAFPDSENAAITNRREFLEQRFALCGEYDVELPANFLTVDFWSVGDVAEVVHLQNKKRGALFV